MSDRFYVTTPIYYVNDRPHIGHAYCTVLADAARRYHRLMGQPTYFVTGTDEHGQKVEQAAAKRGIEPQAHCDELHQAFKDLWPTLDAAPDQFIRTTEPRHKAVVQRALQQLWDQDLIVARTFEGWYCTADERFWTEKDLKEGQCPDCGRAVSRLAEKNYFFLMSRYQNQLIEAIRSGRMEIVPANRANEVLGFLREPLQDLCISRPKERLKWGIDLPFDTDYVTYVWFDALLNYVTAIGGLGALPPTGDGNTPAPGLDGATSFEAWWPHVTHFLGKDILTTHAVYWPTMLMALGLPVPHRLVTTGWWLTDNAKMSKTSGNVVSPLSMKDKYGSDVLRYFLLREMAVGQDSNFSEEALVRRNNADLANDLGNLVQRVMALAIKHFDGKVPTPPADRAHSPALAAAIAYGRYLVDGTPANDGQFGDAGPLRESLAQLRIHKAVADTMGLVQRLNGVLTADAPFHLVKTDKDAAAVTLYNALEGIRFAAHLLEPVLPRTSAEILRRIGWTGGWRSLNDLRWGDLPAGAPLSEGTPMFPKANFVVEPPTAAATEPTSPQVVAPEQPLEPPPPFAEAIDIDAFGKVDLRVGRVVLAEPIPKSKKLLRLLVDLGEAEPRQILAGIAESVAPEVLKDRQVLVLANLPPRTMMGLQSHGMLLVAEDGRGGRTPMSPAREVPPGSPVH
jgi:methionyl-tRNA synthetase